MKAKSAILILLFLGAAGLLAAAAAAEILRLSPAPGKTVSFRAQDAGSLRLLLYSAGMIAALVAAGWVIRSAFRHRTERYRAEIDEKTRSLREATEIYRTLIDNMDALVFLLDREGRYLTMNRHGLQYFHCTPEQLRGKYVEEHLDARSAADFRDCLDLARETGQVSRSRMPVRLNGRERYADLMIKHLNTPSPQEARFMVLLRDVTVQKAAEERTWQTEKLASLGLLVAGVAHEINNPLGIIMGFCELLQGRLADDDAHSRNLSVIHQHCRQCKRTVERLLNFARFSDGSEGPGHPTEALEAVIGILRPACQKRRIALSLDLDPDLPRCATAPDALQQIFMNLIGNAMDAMPGGGRLEVGVRMKRKPPRQGNLHGTLPPVKQYVEISVCDTGTGIPEELQAKIFDPFFTTKPVGQGTGLGLSVVYGLVKKSGGTIVCESPRRETTGTRGGACFRVRLPLAGPER